MYLKSSMYLLLHIRQQRNLCTLFIPQDPQATSIPNSVSCNKTIKGQSLYDFFSSLTTNSGLRNNHNRGVMIRNQFTNPSLKFRIKSSSVIPHENLHSDYLTNKNFSLIYNGYKGSFWHNLKQATTKPSKENQSLPKLYHKQKRRQRLDNKGRRSTHWLWKQGYSRNQGPQKAKHGGNQPNPLRSSNGLLPKQTHAIWV